MAKRQESERKLVHEWIGRAKTIIGNGKGRDGESEINTAGKKRKERWRV